MKIYREVEAKHHRILERIMDSTIAPGDSFCLQSATQEKSYDPARHKAFGSVLEQVTYQL